MRLDPRVTAEEIERSLRVTATAAFGPDRAAEIEYRLPQYARMLALIAAEPVEFDRDPPDLSGIVEEIADD